MAKKRKKTRKWQTLIAASQTGYSAINEVHRHTADGETTHWLPPVSCTSKYRGGGLCLACWTDHSNPLINETIPRTMCKAAMEEPYFE